MKTRIFIAICSQLIMHLTVIGQVDTAFKLPKVRISEINLHAGIPPGVPYIGSLTDFKLLAPESVLLSTVDTGYSRSPGYNATGNSMFSILLGAKFVDKRGEKFKHSPILRVGVSYFGEALAVSNFTKTTHIPYDTLISTQTGQLTYLDSTIRENVGITYTSRQIRLDAAIVYMTSPLSLWSLYAGAGMTAGLSITTKTNLDYSKYVTLVETSQFGGGSSIVHYGLFEDNGKSEEFTNKINYGYSVYAPLGMSFKLGKRHHILKMISINLELSPSIHGSSIQELKTTINTNIGLAVGMKISWI